MDEKYYNSEYKKWCSIIEDSIKKKKINQALSGLSICSELQYNWNQVYTDSVLENFAQKIANITERICNFSIDKMEKTVLFYDGFGLDNRGLALIYLKALAKLNYRVIYVTISKAKGRQTEIEKIITKPNMKKHYISHGVNRKKTLYELQNIIHKYQPDKAFFYSLPYDSVGIVAFLQINKRITTRYQINLTDHAFWLGINAIDYCVEFRNYGAAITNHFRGIDSSRILLLPFYPNIDKEIEFQGFDFPVEGRTIIFSGGALYKTIDEHNTYYHMVELLLKKNPNAIFVYAGSGDDTYLKKIITGFSGRAFHISERKDLFCVMQHITIYLSTYPITGGLMTQYAAAAGKIPVTLKFDSISDDFLINQKDRQIEYCCVDELVNDVTRLLQDKNYLDQREALITNSLNDEAEFSDQLRNILENNATDYTIDFSLPDTSRLRKTYKENFRKEQHEASVATVRNLSHIVKLKRSYIVKILNKVSAYFR